MKLESINMACGYGKRTLMQDLNLSVESGELCCILGPNGVGKTTLFKTMLGFLPVQAGEILLDGQRLEKWTRMQRARAIAYVPQAHIPPFPFQVGEVVLMGRNAHLGAFATPGHTDRRIAREALERLGIAALEHQPYTEISGGERQLVLLARALTQEAEILLLDEPTSHLDLGNQMRVLAHIRDLVAEGMGVLMTTHSPNHAFLCATRVMLLGEDQLPVQGVASAVLTQQNLQASYGADLQVVQLPAREGRCEMTACIPALEPKRNRTFRVLRS